MKKSKKLPVILLMVSLFSCNDYLNVVPDNVATIEYAFRSRFTAEQFLFTCYSLVPIHGCDFDPAIFGSDELFIFEMRAATDYPMYDIKRGKQNVNEPIGNNWDGTDVHHTHVRQGRVGRTSNLFIAIRDCNLFLENIHLVENIDESERNKWIAEVKVLKAYYHFYLMRMYGPIPIIDESLPVSASIDEVRVFREPVDDVVSYITSLIDEAVEDLPLQIQEIGSELGRFTQPIALSIKAKALITAASPLFNGNEAYQGFVDSRGIELVNTDYDQNKWKIAMDATKEAIESTHAGNHQLYEFNDPRYRDLSEETKTIMSIRNAFGEKWNQEVIWGQTANLSTDIQRMALPFFTLQQHMATTSYPRFAPPLHIVEQFYSKDGVPIDEDSDYDFTNRYATSPAIGQKYYVGENFETANLNQNREPRFYANLGFDGGVWFGNGRFKDIGDTTASANETSWVLNAKQGESSGKAADIRYSITGYFIKKYSHFQSGGRVKNVYVRMSFPVIRLADLYLLYAEARNEFSGPDAEVYEYLDKIRERAGLKGVVESWQEHSIYPNKPSTKVGLREIIQQERMIELAFEGKRFWDLRRWKLGDEFLNRPVQGWNIEGKTTNEYYTVVAFDEPLTFTTKEYLWPIKEQTLKVNPNLVQNPYW